MPSKMQKQATERLPESSNLPEADAALKTTHAIASVGIATLNMLETLLPAAAGEVERESRILAKNFTTLVKYINDSEIPPKHISAVIDNIVIAMQFQDRNTQIMDNVTCILERYRTMLQDVCSNIASIHSDEVHGGQTISDAVDGILSSIRLSDIRSRYMEALKKARVSSRDCMLPSAAFDETTNDIEIF